MKIALCIASAASLAAAQFSHNDSTGQFMCAQPNQAYCASASMQNSIIIRCDDQAIGQPGNCNDNLAGYPPVGVNYSPCWQTSDTSGDAACSKNCVVYGASGNYNGTFTLPPDQCTPDYTSTSSSATVTATEPASGSESTIIGTTTTTLCTESETASTGAETESQPATTVTSTAPETTNVPPPVSPSSSLDASDSTASETSNPVTGSVATSTSTSSVTAASATFATAGAVSNDVGFGLGVVGLLVGAIL